MEPEVRIVVVPFPSFRPNGRAWGQPLFAWSGSRDALKGALEAVADALEPVPASASRYRSYLATLEQEGVKGGRTINPLAAVDENQSIRPAPTPADVLMFELGYFDAGSILRARA